MCSHTWTYIHKHSHSSTNIAGRFKFSSSSLVILWGWYLSILFHLLIVFFPNNQLQQPVLAGQHHLCQHGSHGTGPGWTQGQGTRGDICITAFETYSYHNYGVTEEPLATTLIQCFPRFKMCNDIWYELAAPRWFKVRTRVIRHSFRLELNPLVQQTLEELDTLIVNSPTAEEKKTLADSENGALESQPHHVFFPGQFKVAQDHCWPWWGWALFGQVRFKSCPPRFWRWGLG